ncbi:hypothetical protein R4Z09_26145 [Niallia oryzisoli]|uniref:Uncharacterized protein n=1 Tax=Niallia oryzisoli TaxID=1737571 RepID=A0ABZ2CAC4_9BACI
MVSHFYLKPRIKDIGLTPLNWNHARFYAVAKIHGAGDMDIYEYNETNVIPSEECLYAFIENIK